MIKKIKKIAKNFFLFSVVFFALLFSVSCCSKKVPKLSPTLLADHPAKQEAVYFINIDYYMPIPLGEELVISHVASSTGTGGGIRQGDGYTDILTAGHICWTPDALMFAHKDISIHSYHGEVYQGHIMAYQDPGNPDLCIIRIKYERPIMKIASSNPDRGDKVYGAGYPLGMYEPGIIHFVEGYFSGLLSDQSSIWTMPVVGGSSGTLVVNSWGNVVGVVSAVARDFPHLTYGPSIEEISRFLKETKDCSGVEFCKIVE